MKKLFYLIIAILLCNGCEKDEFNPENPDVALFVKKLKTGTYTHFERNEKGELLWLKMPEFKKEDIPILIVFSKDTSYIKAFPINPQSSKTPYLKDHDFFILGECLLWTVEGIRNGSRYGSLIPCLTNSSSNQPYKGLTGPEILEVSELYKNWWSSNWNDEWQDKNPLEGTLFRWN